MTSAELSYKVLNRGFGYQIKDLANGRRVQKILKHDYMLNQMLNTSFKKLDYHHAEIETLAKQDEWVALCEEQASETLLSKTESWYMGANIEGKPRRLLGYLGVGDYEAHCEAVKSSGYAGFELN